MTGARLRLAPLVLLAGVALCALLCPGTANAEDRVVIGSKKFPESALLGEMLAQSLEQRGLTVERRFNLGNTAVAFAALQQGSIDVYPEYSGTALGLLGLDRARTESQAVAVLRRELYQRHSLLWGPPLGFDNSYALAVREDFARRHRLRNLSDLAAHSRAQPVRFAVSHEFLAREDGYRALARRYGLAGEPRGVEHGLAYQLLTRGQSDVIDVYTTEGLVFEHRLVVLGDDAGFFPRYQAAYVFVEKLQRDPRFLASLTELSGTLDDATMRALNRRVEVAGVPPSDVARDFLTPPRTGTASPPRALRKELGFFGLLAQDRHAIGGHLVRHLELTLIAMALCLLVGLPLGYAATRSGWAASLALGTSGALQTIPSLALLVFAIPIVSALFTPLGQGALVLEGAALFALFLYALLPVVRNTKEGLEGVDPALVEAARGLGMTERQVLGWVRFPLALPVILAGVRTSFVITVGGATLAAFVGAGGLGVPIITGLSLHNFAEVWTGAVPAALLALGSDAAFGLLQRWLARRLFGAAA